MRALRHASSQRCVSLGTSALLALGAILATGCESGAPTDSRKSAERAGTRNVGGVDLALAAGASPAAAPVKGALSLPIVQSYSGAGPVFALTHTGTAANAQFTIDNPANNSVALLGQSNGSGGAVQGVALGTSSAGLFQTVNASNGVRTLLATTNGVGTAGEFSITNSANGSATIFSGTNGSGPAIYGKSTGTAWGGFFEINNSSNAFPALYAKTNGTGYAGDFQCAGKCNAALHATRGVGTGPALLVEGGPQQDGALVEFVSPTEVGQAGQGVVLDVIQSSSQQSSPALWALNYGTGYAAYFQGATDLVSRGVLIQVTGNQHALDVVGQSVFGGDVTVGGTLTKAAGSFRIDHPLDPEHKYLSHSFVESPDMMNVYNGNATLDAKGRATIELPDWFEALNKDFRYQLTAIGAPGPNLYIAQEIAHNRFQIAGGRANGRVSWQVTGVRHDAYADAHRIKVEEVKPAAEQGREKFR